MKANEQLTLGQAEHLTDAVHERLRDGMRWSPERQQFYFTEASQDSFSPVPGVETIVPRGRKPRAKRGLTDLGREQIAATPPPGPRPVEGPLTPGEQQTQVAQLLRLLIERRSAEGKIDALRAMPDAVILDATRILYDPDRFVGDVGTAALLRDPANIAHAKAHLVRIADLLTAQRARQVAAGSAVTPKRRAPAVESKKKVDRKALTERARQRRGPKPPAE
jgi:hypothetical protein